MSISRRARGARADVSSQGRLWERDTDTGMGCSDGVMCDGVMPGAGGRPAQIQ